MDETRAAGAFDFFPEEADVNVHDVAFGRGVEIVNVLPDVGAGDDSADVVGEVFEQSVFAAAEIDGSCPPAGRVRWAVSTSRSAMWRTVELVSVFSADHRSDAGEQLGEQERLDEIIISAEFEAIDFVLGGVLGGEKEGPVRDIAAREARAGR